MRETKSLSTREVNRSTGRTGPLWQYGFHDRALRREENLEKMARYVVANPLRAGLVDTIADYPLWDTIWIRNETELPPSLASQLPQDSMLFIDSESNP